MKKNLGRIISLLLVLVMVCGCAVLVSASPKSNTEDKKNPVVSDKTATDVKNDIQGVLDTADADKQETVYVIAGADGTVQKVIVSELLKNADNKDTINDVTDLKDIVNVKSDAEYTMDGTSCVWDAQGEDIYYQGTTDKEVPVTFTITFKLDGKNVSAEELAGASGKVEITFDYKNTQKETVSIDGKDEEIYVPFLMLSGMILNNDNFKNIEVSNGKVISDGDKSIVIGYALPGMKENLDLDSDVIEIPNSFTISADVTDFSLETTLTVATNDIFNHVDLDGVDSVDDLKSELTKLDDATKQLIDGSSQLYDGTTKLLEGANKLADGVSALATGSAQLSAGANQLYEGTVLYQSKLTELNKGLAELSGHSEELNAGGKQVFDSLIATVQTQLNSAGLDSLGISVPKLTTSNYGTELDKITAILTEEKITAAVKSKVTAKVEESNDIITAQVTDAVLSSQGMTKAQYDQGVAAGMITPQQQAAINAAIDQNVAAKKQELINNSMASEEVKEQIASAVAGGKALSAAKKQLDAYAVFYKGLTDYTSGVDTAAAGAGQLTVKFGDIVKGSKDLSDNLKVLVEKVNLMNSSMPELTNGASDLKDGAGQLSDGLNQYYDEGIKTIFDKVDDIAPVFTRLKATVDVSKDYQSFGGISDDMTGNVKFIYRTDSIK